MLRITEREYYNLLEEEKKRNKKLVFRTKKGYWRINTHK